MGAIRKKTECLRKLILVGTQSLENAVGLYVTHYNLHRPHQSLGNEPITEDKTTGTGSVTVTETLGGVLKHYHRSAA